MAHLRRTAVLAALAAAVSGAALAQPKVDVVPHRALYVISLASAKAGSGIVDAKGTLVFEWGDTCEGWTVEQRFRLLLVSSAGEVGLGTNFLTWESKDGLRYRFNIKKTRDGEPGEEVKGEARLEGAGLPGASDLAQPKGAALKLPAGTLFPTEHTLLLIERARAGDKVVPRVVYDGVGGEGPSEVNAVIGRALAPTAEKLLDRPGWAMRLAFFSIEKKGQTPDYELGLELQDNGVTRSLVLDYGEFAVKGTLEKIEALPKSGC